MPTQWRLTGVMPLFLNEKALRPVAVASASANAKAPVSFKPRSYETREGGWWLRENINSRRRHLLLARSCSGNTQVERRATLTNGNLSCGAFLGVYVLMLLLMHQERHTYLTLIECLPCAKVCHVYGQRGTAVQASSIDCHAYRQVKVLAVAEVNTSTQIIIPIRRNKRQMRKRSRKKKNNKKYLRSTSRMRTCTVAR